MLSSAGPASGCCSPRAPLKNCKKPVVQIPFKKSMEAIIAALITGFLGPALTLFVQKRLKNSELPSSTNERLDRLRGKWYGSFSQLLEGQEASFDVVIFLRNRGRAIEGEVSYENKKGDETSLVLFNGLFDGNVLKVEYRNKLSYVFQAGSVVVEMNARGDELNGKFVGYSPQQNKIISGEVHCSNQPSR